MKHAMLTQSPVMSLFQERKEAVTHMTCTELHHQLESWITSRVSDLVSSCAVTNKEGDVLGGVNAYDPLRKTLWMELANNHTLQLFSLDVTSGKWTNVNIPNPLNLETMSYDNVTGLFYGIGLREIGQNWTRILMTFDGRTLDFETVADIPGYLMIDANMAGIDLTGRRLFCVLEPTKKNEIPYQLITVDIKTGKILSNPEIPNTDLFPWSIEYYNGK
jgi:hypothetical protein